MAEGRRLRNRNPGGPWRGAASVEAVRAGLRSTIAAPARYPGTA
jgi:hypothetical protein